MYKLIFNDSDGSTYTDATAESIDGIKTIANQIVKDREEYNKPLLWVDPIDCDTNTILMADYCNNDFTMFYTIVV